MIQSVCFCLFVCFLFLFVFRRTVFKIQQFGLAKVFWKARKVSYDITFPHDIYLIRKSSSPHPLSCESGLAEWLCHLFVPVARPQGKCSDIHHTTSGRAIFILAHTYTIILKSECTFRDKYNNNGKR